MLLRNLVVSLFKEKKKKFAAGENQTRFFSMSRSDTCRAPAYALHTNTHIHRQIASRALCIDVSGAPSRLAFCANLLLSKDMHETYSTSHARQKLSRYVSFGSKRNMVKESFQNMIYFR